MTPPGPGAAAPRRADGRLAACAITAIGSLTPRRLGGLLRAGCDFVQLRDRRASDRRFEEFLALVAEEAPEAVSRLLVNDRPALALAYPVAGVHLPEAGLRVRDAVELRERSGRRFLVGRSAHGPEAAAEAEAEGADYVQIGPVFPTASKPRPLARSALRETLERCSLPVWAVGGLAPGTLGELRLAEPSGGSRLAGAAAVRALADPLRAAAFVAGLDRLRGLPPRRGAAPSGAGNAGGGGAENAGGGGAENAAGGRAENAAGGGAC